MTFDDVCIFEKNKVKIEGLLMESVLLKNCSQWFRDWASFDRLLVFCLSSLASSCPQKIGRNAVCDVG